jgi:hypothetical protein
MIRKCAADAVRAGLEPQARHAAYLAAMMSDRWDAAQWRRTARSRKVGRWRRRTPSESLKRRDRFAHANGRARPRHIAGANGAPHPSLEPESCFGPRCASDAEATDGGTAS